MFCSRMHRCHGTRVAFAAAVALAAGLASPAAVAQTISWGTGSYLGCTVIPDGDFDGQTGNNGNLLGTDNVVMTNVSETYTDGTNGHIYLLCSASRPYQLSQPAWVRHTLSVSGTWTSTLTTNVSFGSNNDLLAYSLPFGSPFVAYGMSASGTSGSFAFGPVASAPYNASVCVTPSTCSLNIRTSSHFIIFGDPGFTITFNFPTSIDATLEVVTVPAVSDWGLIVLGGTLLAMAAVAALRRGSAATA